MFHLLDGRIEENSEIEISIINYESQRENVFYLEIKSIRQLFLAFWLLLI